MVLTVIINTHDFSCMAPVREKTAGGKVQWVKLKWFHVQTQQVSVDVRGTTPVFKHLTSSKLVQFKPQETQENATFLTES